jgi:hypothetical protein
VHVSCDRPQIVVRFTIADIASAKDLLDFSWDEKFLEFGGQVVGSVGDVKIANDEDENHGGRGDVGGRDGCVAGRPERPLPNPNPERTETDNALISHINRDGP